MPRSLHGFVPNARISDEEMDHAYQEAMLKLLVNLPARLYGYACVFRTMYVHIYI